MATVIPALLTRAETGEIEALAELDANGLPAGPNEALPEYLERLRGLQARLLEAEEALETTGVYRCAGLRLRRARRVSAETLRQCTGATLELYKFQIDWVPAFYINPSFSWLFGGCAYYSHPDTFALMIIRRSFARRRKWFIYDRNEILAHEMCHVARLALGSSAYEERIAYRVSESAFRRRFGGVFESPRDSFSLLGSTLLLLGAQLARMFLIPALPIWPFWFLVGGVVAFLLGRDRQRHRVMRQAEENLVRLLTVDDAAESKVGEPRLEVERSGVLADANGGEGETAAATESDGTGEGRHDAKLEAIDAVAILFRCTDREIATIAGLSNPRELQAWLTAREKKELRWQVTTHRFLR